MHSAYGKSFVNME